MSLLVRSFGSLSALEKTELYVAYYNVLQSQLNEKLHSFQIIRNFKGEAIYSTPLPCIENIVGLLVKGFGKMDGFFANDAHYKQFRPTFQVCLSFRTLREQFIHILVLIKRVPFNKLSIKQKKWKYRESVQFEHFFFSLQ